MSSIHAMASHLPAANMAKDTLRGAPRENAPAENAAKTKEISGTASRPGEPHAPLRPDRDEYCPGEPPQPSGRYWPEQDAEGRRVVRVDQAPAAPAPAEGGKAGAEKEAVPAKEAPRLAEEERCTVSTDKVDREIRRLKEEKARLEQQLQQGPPPQKEAQMNQKLQQVKEELRQKDNDTYRRQHAEYSFS